ncbi:hypothetical protein [Micrococcus terreus]|uniref:hypothetical protein n=1 Tax=Micrococcus terreus TaxID=574650 RepID=UPI0023F8BBBA|nr:hypothetical protein [Micrococcus terreus]
MGTQPSDHARGHHASLDQALEAWNIPRENRPLIRTYVQGIGFERFEDRSGYLKGTRSDGGPPLHIAYGWSSGFTSEQEARTSAGPAQDVWRSERKGLWGFTHPVHRMHHGCARSRNEDRAQEICQVCFMQRSAAGTCSCD